MTSPTAKRRARGVAGALALVVTVLVAGCSRSTTPEGSPTESSAQDGSTAASPGTQPAGGCTDTGAIVATEAPFTGSEPEPTNVYVPACYDAQPSRRFPVLYLLHGANADQTQWGDVGIARAADELISNEEIPPLIIVMPDGGRSMPDSLTEGLTTRLIPWAQSRYRTSSEAAGRAVGGISRGGRVALLAAAQHPDLFAAVGGHSPAVQSSDAVPDVWTGLAGGSVAIALDCGDMDSLHQGVVGFGDALRSHGVAVQTTTWPGSHDRLYWSDHVVDYLRFYGAHLR